MKKKLFIKYFTGKGLAIIAMALVIVIAACGCSTTNGDLKRDATVTRIFKAYKVLPDYRYYYTGPQGRPDAIIGVHNNYQLESTMWTAVDLTSNQLKKWVSWMDSRYGTSTQRYPYGSLILGPEGEKIGMWYSVWRWTTVIVEEDNRLIIYPPDTEDVMNGRKDAFGRPFR